MTSKTTSKTSKTSKPATDGDTLAALPESILGIGHGVTMADIVTYGREGDLAVARQSVAILYRAADTGESVRAIAADPSLNLSKSAIGNRVTVGALLVARGSKATEAYALAIITAVNYGVPTDALKAATTARAVTNLVTARKAERKATSAKGGAKGGAKPAAVRKSYATDADAYRAALKSVTMAPGKPDAKGDAALVALVAALVPMMWARGIDPADTLAAIDAEAAA